MATIRDNLLQRGGIRGRVNTWGTVFGDEHMNSYTIL